jgi:hypothetical protein
MVTAQQTAIRPPDIAPWRFRLGMILFALVLPPCAVIAPIVLSHLSLSAIAMVTSGLVIVQQFLLVAATAVLGKPGFLYLKSKLSRRVMQLAPAYTVGPVRHRIGLVMFCIPLVLDWIQTYAGNLTSALVTNRLWIDVGGDFLLLASLFVLGGNFWDKVRALFIREATAHFPSDPVAASQSATPRTH